MCRPILIACLLLCCLVIIVPSHAQWVQVAALPARVTTLVASGSELLAATFGAGVYRSTDSGDNWQAINSGLTSNGINALAVSGPTLFAASNLGGVFRSTDNGQNWTAVNQGLPVSYIWSVGISGPYVFSAPNFSGVYRSVDNGSTWSLANNGIPSDEQIRAFAVIGSNLFTGARGIYRSTNNGDTWVKVYSSDTGFFLLAADTRLFSAGFWVNVSVDNGNTWTRIINDISLGPFCLAANGPDLIVGMNKGVYVYQKHGDVWVSYDAHLTEGVSSVLVFGQYLFAGGSTGKLWRHTLTELTSVESPSPDVPTTFGLEQNYPNPFNPSTTIRYSLPHRSHVTLTVFNTLGQQVAELVNGDMDAGIHEVQFNANHPASGMYFYTLRAGTFNQTRRLLLVQ